MGEAIALNSGYFEEGDWEAQGPSFLFLFHFCLFLLFSFHLFPYVPGKFNPKGTRQDRARKAFVPGVEGALEAQSGVLVTDLGSESVCIGEYGLAQ